MRVVTKGDGKIWFEEDNGNLLQMRDAVAKYGTVATDIMKTGKVHKLSSIPESVRTRETWATTDELLYPDEVGDDAYCIENNWDEVDGYFIMDVPSLKHRLVHSDVHGVNEKVSIGQR